MICPVCGGENRDDYKFCAHCGTRRPGAPGAPGQVYKPEMPTIQATPPQATYYVPPAAPAQPPVYAPEPDYSQVPASTPPRKRRWWLTCLILLLILLCLAVVALAAVAYFKPEWLPFDIPFFPNQNNLIIGLPHDKGDEPAEMDLYMVRMGRTVDQGVLLANRAEQADSYMVFMRQDTLYSLAGYSFLYGGFVPEQDYLLYWYTDAERITLNRMDINDKTPITLYEERADTLGGYLLPNLQDLLLVDYLETEGNCYYSQAGAGAERILQGSNCYPSGDLSTAFAIQWEDSTTRADIYTLADMAQYTPLDVDQTISFVEISGDGTRLSYTNLDEAPNLIMLNSQDGETMVEGLDAYAILDQGFAQRGHIGYYISENDEATLDLYLLSDAGASLVRTAPSIGAELSLDGSHLVYMAGEIDGERTLYVRDVASGSDVEVMSGEQMYFAIANPLNRIFLSTVSNTEYGIFSANIDGSGIVSLYNGGSDSTETYLLNISYIPDQPYIFLHISTPDGFSLLATRPDQADEYMVVEGWADVTPLDTSADGLQLLFSGVEDDEDSQVLYLADLANKNNTTLDDDFERIGNALFSAAGDTVIYTAITGENADDAEVRRMPVDKSEPAEVLYAEAVLIAAQWDTLQPFQYNYYLYPYQSTSYCPGADPITLGTPLEATLEGGTPDCFRYRGTAGEEVTFWIDEAEGMDTMLSLYDRQGNYLDSDDYGYNGTDPRLIVTLPADGLYFLEATSFGDAAGNYRLSSVEGTQYCPGADPLAAGDALSGELDGSGQIFYQLTGNANDTFTFWVESENLDPMLSLYDQEGNYLGNDDNSRSALDPLLITTLPEDGSYCLQVSNNGVDTGSYTVYMAEGSIFCPGAETIDLDQTVTGSVSNGSRTCYTFTAEAGVDYTFVVFSPTGTDTYLELYDATGYLLDTDDDSGQDNNPELEFTPFETGSYYIVIRGYSSSSSGDYEMTFILTPEVESPFPTAAFLPYNSRVRGAITATDYIYLEEYDYESYGDMYYFDAVAGQNVQIDAFGNSMGSEVDTYLALFDENGLILDEDDDGGDAGFDSRITYNLPYTGRYYVLVIDYSDDYGSESYFYYELLLTSR